MALYNLKSTGTVLYSITKFDQDLNPEATYSVARTACDCPAGARATCRHRQMLPTLLERVDTAWFYNFETKSWEDPTGEAKADADQAKPLCGCGVEGCPNDKGDLCDMFSQRGESPMLNAAPPAAAQITSASKPGFRRRI